MRDPVHIGLLKFLLRLYPASFRRRHGGAVIESARAAARRPGGARPVAVIADALLTLVRAWLGAGAPALTGPDPRRVLLHVGMDARFAFRALRRDPLPAFVLITTLAIAIGANAAIYTVTHALLLEQLPYAHAEHIVEVDRAPVDMQFAGGTVKWKPAGVFADHAGVELAATYYVDGGANLVTGDDASRVRVTQISEEFYDVLGVRMLLGTSAVVSGGNDAVLSYGLWRSAFGSDPGVLGRTPPVRAAVRPRARRRQQRSQEHQRHSRTQHARVAMHRRFVAAGPACRSSRCRALNCAVNDAAFSHRASHRPWRAPAGWLSHIEPVADLQHERVVAPAREQARAIATQVEHARAEGTAV